MTENHQTDAPKTKMSLQEAVKQKLEAKKNQNAQSKAIIGTDLSAKKMKSQQTKKTMNTRRKMGV
ncbi:hypothetical protein ACOQFO_02990 [Ureibacillus sp. MALMAid1270]|uniref:hypothetical protein n=1 Tax=Ureibacillus sp. MALMAid1270 TaxID=3411629 RepID=UPI003BA72F37